MVVGDGEEAIPMLLEDLRRGEMKRVYESLGPALSNLKPPRFDLVPKGVMGGVAPVEASRGCPNACSFCAVSDLYKSSIRVIPVDIVMRDIDQVEKLGKRLIYFTDPNFTGDMTHAKSVLRGLLRRQGNRGDRSDRSDRSDQGGQGNRGRQVHWLASVDIRALDDDEFLNLARETGCFGLQVGFETLQPEELRRLHKAFAAKADYPALVRKAQNAGIPVVALMMLGFDSDTQATFGAVQEFLEKNHVSMVVLHPLVPVPGTPIHERLSAEGRLGNIDPAEADGLHLFFEPKNFSPGAFIEGFWKLNQGLFRLRSIVRRFLFPGFFRNPMAYAILLITSLFFAPKLIKRRLPMGMYE